MHSATALAGAVSAVNDANFMVLSEHHILWLRCCSDSSRLPYGTCTGAGLPGELLLSEWSQATVESEP